tara:strand:- start:93605 stop:93721 length:117 start_codon:yes stop_codon:yes gene_type:complete
VSFEIKCLKITKSKNTILNGKRRSVLGAPFSAWPIQKN